MTRKSGKHCVRHSEQLDSSLSGRVNHTQCLPDFLVMVIQFMSSLFLLKSKATSLGEKKSLDSESVN